jgi:xanthine/CO dehydrogenase XdhC/CoxF family maturation factor
MAVEVRELLRVWRQISRDDAEAAALVTVVRVAGSSYRKPGARMLVTSRGLRVGTISGGCLEAEVSKQIWWLTKDGSCIRDYSSSIDDDSRPSYGLGCEGVVSLLLERVSDSLEVLQALERSVRQRTSSAIVTVVGSKSPGARVGSRIVFTEDNVSFYECDTHKDLQAVLQPIALRVFEEKRSSAAFVLYQHAELELFAEYIQPPPAIFIFGAGDDAQPLAHFAHSMGWEVTVADGRSHLASRSRFPSAHHVVVLRENEPLSNVNMGAEDVAVVLTHSYHQDVSLLRDIMRIQPRYIGVLGPRRRTERIVQEIAGDADINTDEVMATLKSPVGLDLGAGSPEVIALSIVAEIQAVLSRRSAKHLHSL